MSHHRVGGTYVRAAIAAHAGWRELLDRLPPQTSPAAAGVRDALAAQQP